jgi:hypothetical protein
MTTGQARRRGWSQSCCAPQTLVSTVRAAATEGWPEPSAYLRPVAYCTQKRSPGPTERAERSAISSSPALLEHFYPSVRPSVERLRKVPDPGAPAENVKDRTAGQGAGPRFQPRDPTHPRNRNEAERDQRQPGHAPATAFPQVSSSSSSEISREQKSDTGETPRPSQPEKETRKDIPEHAGRSIAPRDSAE